MYWFQRRFVPAAVALLGCAGAVHAAEAPRYVSMGDGWYASDEGKKVIAGILSWQMPTGGWPKAYDCLTINTDPIPHVHPHVGNAAAAAALVAEGGEAVWDCATIDNDATHSELRILARAVTLTNNEDARKGFFKGLDSVLAAQYPNGGFPQRWPPQKNYGRYITFNDNAMMRLMVVLESIGNKEEPFKFVDEARRKKAEEAFEKGLDCILKCQIVKDVKLTCWCAQHDDVTLEPRGARAYELPSLSGSEGANVALFLMRLPHPDERVRRAVEGAAAWFDSVKIVGKRLGVVVNAQGGRDRTLLDDPASTVWARFYDIETGKPFFCGRDGVKKWSLTEIEAERRNGYSWYGGYGEAVAREYAAWKKRVGGTADSTRPG